MRCLEATRIVVDQMRPVIALMAPGSPDVCSHCRKGCYHWRHEVCCMPLRCLAGLCCRAKQTSGTFTLGPNGEVGPYVCCDRMLLSQHTGPHTSCTQAPIHLACRPLADAGPHLTMHACMHACIYPACLQAIDHQAHLAKEKEDGHNDWKAASACDVAVQAVALCV